MGIGGNVVEDVGTGLSTLDRADDHGVPGSSGMRTIIRAVWTLLALTLAGCSSAVGGQARPAASSGPAGFGTAEQAHQLDMCALFQDSELGQLGVAPPAEPDKTSQEVGCHYDGPDYLLGLTKSVYDDPIEYYRKRGQGGVYVDYRENEINGRPGATFRLSPPDKKIECAQVLIVGPSSVVISAVNRAVHPTTDPCTEAVALARIVEPRLPRG